MLFNLGYGAGGAGDSMNFTVVGGTTEINVSGISSLKLKIYAGTNYYIYDGHMSLNIDRIWLE